RVPAVSPRGTSSGRHDTRHPAPWPTQPASQAQYYITRRTITHFVELFSTPPRIRSSSARRLQTQDLVGLAALLEYDVGLALVRALVHRADLGHDLVRAGVPTRDRDRLVVSLLDARVDGEAATAAGLGQRQEHPDADRHEYHDRGDHDPDDEAPLRLFRLLDGGVVVPEAGEARRLRPGIRR